MYNCIKIVSVVQNIQKIEIKMAELKENGNSLKFSC